MARPRMAKDALPDFEADAGPLTARELNAVRKIAAASLPSGKVLNKQTQFSCLSPGIFLRRATSLGVVSPNSRNIHLARSCGPHGCLMLLCENTALRSSWSLALHSASTSSRPTSSPSMPSVYEPPFTYHLIKMPLHPHKHPPHILRPTKLCKRIVERAISKPQQQ